MGMFGGGQRPDYTAIGSEVNIAARLQEVADSGMILVSAKVAQFLNPGEITLMKSLQLKGVEEEVTMFSVVVNYKEI